MFSCLKFGLCKLSCSSLWVFFMICLGMWFCRFACNLSPSFPSLFLPFYSIYLKSNLCLRSLLQLSDMVWLFYYSWFNEFNYMRRDFFFYKRRQSANYLVGQNGSFLFLCVRNSIFRVASRKKHILSLLNCLSNLTGFTLILKGHSWFRICFKSPTKATSKTFQPANTCCSSTHPSIYF